MHSRATSSQQSSSQASSAAMLAKKRKPKGYPKNPMTAYKFFMKNFKSIGRKDELTNLMSMDENKNKTIAKVISEKWRKLTKEDKALYEDQSVHDRERHDREVESWNRQHAGSHYTRERMMRAAQAAQAAEDTDPDEPEPEDAEEIAANLAAAEKEKVAQAAAAAAIAGGDTTAATTSSSAASTSSTTASTSASSSSSILSSTTTSTPMVTSGDGTTPSQSSEATPNVLNTGAVPSAPLPSTGVVQADGSMMAPILPPITTPVVSASSVNAATTGGMVAARPVTHEEFLHMQQQHSHAHPSMMTPLTTLPAGHGPSPSSSLATQMGGVGMVRPPSPNSVAAAAAAATAAGHPPSMVPNSSMMIPAGPHGQPPQVVAGGVMYYPHMSHMYPSPGPPGSAQQPILTVTHQPMYSMPMVQPHGMGAAPATMSTSNNITNNNRVGGGKRKADGSEEVDGSNGAVGVAIVDDQQARRKPRGRPPSAARTSAARAQTSKRARVTAAPVAALGGGEMTMLGGSPIGDVIGVDASSMVVGGMPGSPPIVPTPAGVSASGRQQRSTAGARGAAAARASKQQQQQQQHSGGDDDSLLASSVGIVTSGSQRRGASKQRVAPAPLVEVLTIPVTATYTDGRPERRIKFKMVDLLRRRVTPKAAAAAAQAAQAQHQIQQISKTKGRPPMAGTVVSPSIVGGHGIVNPATGALIRTPPLAPLSANSPIMAPIGVPGIGLPSSLVPPPPPSSSSSGPSPTTGNAALMAYAHSNKHRVAGIGGVFGGVAVVNKVGSAMMPLPPSFDATGKSLTPDQYYSATQQAAAAAAAAAASQSIPDSINNTIGYLPSSLSGTMTTLGDHHHAGSGLVDVPSLTSGIQLGDDLLDAVDGGSSISSTTTMSHSGGNSGLLESTSSSPAPYWRIPFENRDVFIPEIDPLHRLTNGERDPFHLGAPLPPPPPPEQHHGGHLGLAGVVRPHNIFPSLTSIPPPPPSMQHPPPPPPHMPLHPHPHDNGHLMLPSQQQQQQQVSTLINNNNRVVMPGHVQHAWPSSLPSLPPPPPPTGGPPLPPQL
jgi:hypothetical protein